jgi:hypothetical protein
MYLGAAVGLLYQALTAPRRGGTAPKRLWPILGLLIVAFGVDGFNSFLHLAPTGMGWYEPQNWSRLLTGTGMGVVLAALVHPSFNQTVWSDYDPAPALPGFRSFIMMVFLALAVAALALTDNPLLLYPLALISAGTVVALLTMIYTMVWLIVLRRENQFQRLSQLAVPLVGGFGVALLQITILDWGRYFLTGTWGGFFFG